MYIYAHSTYEYVRIKYVFTYIYTDLEIEVEERRVDTLPCRMTQVVIFMRPPIRAHVRRRFLRKSCFVYFCDPLSCLLLRPPLLFTITTPSRPASVQ